MFLLNQGRVGAYPRLAAPPEGGWGSGTESNSFSGQPAPATVWDDVHPADVRWRMCLRRAGLSDFYLLLIINRRWEGGGNCNQLSHQPTAVSLRWGDKSLSMVLALRKTDQPVTPLQFAHLCNGLKIEVVGVKHWAPVGTKVGADHLSTCFLAPMFPPCGFKGPTPPPTHTYMEASLQFVQSLLQALPNPSHTCWLSQPGPCGSGSSHDVEVQNWVMVVRDLG